MNTVKNLLFAAIVLILTGCGSSDSGDVKTVKVLDVQQAGPYTYLEVKGKGPKHWVAVPTMNALAGETYTYQGGLLMTDFYSEELDRTFKEVLFIESLEPEAMDHPEVSGMMDHQGRVPVEKSEVSMETIEGAVSIADLYKNPRSYNGKTVRVTGEVVKFNPEIMDRNWIHIQDGTEYEGKFDLTITSSEYFETGDMIVMEGTLAVDKDFGYGYSYELLLEDATSVK
jgi:hypothetical protein